MLLVSAVLVVAVSGCSRSSETVPPAGSTYTLMQMNLCLSGLAGCYRKAAYPAVVEEAVARIREADPDAVTFNEACRSDVGPHRPADRLPRALLEGHLRRRAPALRPTRRPRALR